MGDTDLELNFSDFYFDHFQHDGRNDQYKTPLCSKDNSPNGNDSESIEIVETPSNTYRGPLQESTISSASTNNTDICVLDSPFTNEEKQFLSDNVEELGDYVNTEGYNASERCDEICAVDVLDKHEDFTVVQKPSQARRICKCEESTEVLMLINSEYEEKHKPTYSGTDSDVEVLMSEEIIDSDWSSGNDCYDMFHKKPLLQETNVKSNLMSKNDLSSPFCLQHSCEGNSLKAEDSTDIDVSDDELVDGSDKNDKYQHLNRIELLQLIQRQELCITDLENTVERYQRAQQRLFDHVDALRVELNEIRTTPFRNIKQPNEI